MAGVAWHYVLKFIITGKSCSPHILSGTLPSLFHESHTLPSSVPSHVVTPLCTAWMHTFVFAQSEIQVTLRWGSHLCSSDLRTSDFLQTQTQQCVYLLFYLSVCL